MRAKCNTQVCIKKMQKIKMMSKGLINFTYDITLEEGRESLPLQMASTERVQSSN